MKDDVPGMCHTHLPTHMVASKPAHFPSNLLLLTFSVTFVFQEPFCLYPGESLLGAEHFCHGSSDYSGAIKPQPVIQANHALKIRAVLDHTDSKGIKRNAGDEWQIEGPCLFYPSPNVVSIN